MHRSCTAFVSALSSGVLIASVAVTAADANATSYGRSGTAVHWWPYDSNSGGTMTAGVTAVAVGTDHILTLDVHGRVTQGGWLSQPRVPDSARDIVAIDAAGGTSIALRSDGVVIGWGGDYETSAPQGLSGVKAIAVGESMGAALRLDGTIETWGLTDYGQHEFAVGITGATAIAVGTYHALAVTADGTVVGSGGPHGDSPAARPPKGLTGVESVSAGQSHSLALKSDGTVVAWGSNTYGESTVPPGLKNIAAVEAGHEVSFAINTRGEVISWGRAAKGRPAVPVGLRNVSTISAGPLIVAAVTTSHAPTVPVDVSVNAKGNPPVVIWAPPIFHTDAIVGYRVEVSPGTFQITLSRFARSYRLPRRSDSSPYTVTVAAITTTGTGAAARVRVAKNDFRTFNPRTAQWLHRGAAPLIFGRTGDKPAAGDYNGDGVVDLAVFRPSTGQWLVRGRPPVKFGQAGDVPVPADYDGDGTADIAVFRPSTGVWHIKGFANRRLGQSGDIPVPADYSGSGLADVTVFRPSTGTWHTATAPWYRGLPEKFGRRGDIPTPGDYNGKVGTKVDAEVEYSFYRPSNATWQPPGEGRGVRFGQRGDIPVVGDYNADGLSDFALFRPSTGVWYIRGAQALRLGGPGVIPLAPPLRVGAQH